MRQVLVGSTPQLPKTRDLLEADLFFVVVLELGNYETDLSADIGWSD